MYFRHTLYNKWRAEGNSRWWWSKRTILLATLLVSCKGEISSPPPPVASIDVSPASASLQAGQTIQFTAVPRAKDGRALGIVSLRDLVRRSLERG